MDRSHPGNQALLAQSRFGALDYNDGLISDHHGLFINFDPQTLFDGITNAKILISLQGFTSKNEKTITKYMDLLEMYWLKHRISCQITKHREDAPSLDQKNIQSRYNAID